MNLWTVLLVEEEGEMTTEYALLTAFISVLLIGAYAVINIYGVKVQPLLENLLQAIPL